MGWVKIHSQAELDAAIAAGVTCVEIAAQITVELRVPDGVRLAIKSIPGAVAKVLSGSVEASGSARVLAWESASVEAWDSASVVAWGSSRVEAWGSSRVVARGSSRVVARESARVMARESSRVEASGSARVVASGSARVVARESARVEAWGSSRVEAWGSSRVEAWGSSRVDACGAVALSVFGPAVTATASAYCAAHLHQGARCVGGVQIVVPEIDSADKWCEWYGAKVDGGNAVLYKGVNSSFRSAMGADYTPGTETVAGDWDGGNQECGCGLHFSPTAAATREFAPDATRFVRCLVPLELIAVHPRGAYPQKVKAQRCWNQCEVDCHGNVIGEVYAKSAVEVQS